MDRLSAKDSKRTFRTEQRSVVCVQTLQSGLILCNPVGYSPPGSSDNGTLIREKKKKN